MANLPLLLRALTFGRTESAAAFYSPFRTLLFGAIWAFSPRPFLLETGREAIALPSRASVCFLQSNGFAADLQNWMLRKEKLSMLLGQPNESLVIKYADLSNVIAR